MDTNVKRREWVKTVAIIFLAVLLVLTFFSNTIMNASLPEVATQQVTQGTINAKIRASGTIAANETYNVKLTQTRKIESVKCKVGQEVNAGDVLFVLEAQESDELKQAKTDLETLELNYQKSLIEASNGTAQEDRDVQKLRDAYNEALAIYSQYSTMESPFTTAATYVFGDFAGLVINIAAWIAAVTCLIGEIFSVSRLTHGMAVEKALPPVLAKVDKKGNPYVGVIFGYIVAVIIVLIGSVEALENFYLTIATLGSVAGTLNMTICLIASFLYKRKFPEEWANLCWHMPLRKITYPLAFIGCIALFISLYAGAISALIPSVIFVALIILFYLFYSSKHIDKTEA